MNDLQPLGLILPVYTDVHFLTIFEAVCLCHITLRLLCFLVAHASLGLLALFSLFVCTREYNVDDLYPLHVHIRYPVKVVTACTACVRMMNTWTTYRDIDRYIHKYSDFLVVMISVWLASVRPKLTIMTLSFMINCYRESVRLVCQHAFIGQKSEKNSSISVSVSSSDGGILQLEVMFGV